jgi:hypothetical protein
MAAGWKVKITHPSGLTEEWVAAIEGPEDATYAVNAAALSTAKGTIQLTLLTAEDIKNLGLMAGEVMRL